MGRPKNFNRKGVLDRAIPVFWKHGFANTTLQHLEEATGVNKSGLYPTREQNCFGRSSPQMSRVKFLRRVPSPPARMTSQRPAPLVEAAPSGVAASVAIGADFLGYSPRFWTADICLLSLDSPGNSR